MVTTLLAGRAASPLELRPLMTPRPHQAASIVALLLALTAPRAAAEEPHLKAKANANAKVHANANAGHAANAIRQEAAAEHRARVQQQHAAIRNQEAERNRANAAGGAHHPGPGVGAHHVTGAHGIHGIASGPMVSSLHSVVGHLQRAEHDYDGHRVQAIHQLGQAIHTLQPGTGTGTSRRTGAAGGSKMSQAESDNHLRQAHQELLALEFRMSAVATGAGAQAHHRQAHAHVQQALQHLNAALTTR